MADSVKREGGGWGDVAMQPDVVHIFCFSFCRCFCCRWLRSLLFAISNRICPSVSRIPFSVFRIPYAICRVPFPDLCNSMHVPHFCSKTCRTCRMWPKRHTRRLATKIPQKVPQTASRGTDFCSASLLCLPVSCIEFWSNMQHALAARRITLATSCHLPHLPRLLQLAERAACLCGASKAFMQNKASNC